MSSPALTLLLQRLGLGLLLCLACACAAPVSVAQAPAGGSLPGPAGDLQAGRPFVAVLIDQTNQRLLASEAYADWHTYYQQFAVRAQGRLTLHTLSPAAGRTLLPQLPPDTANATLFVDGKGQALFHRGLILEPQVYALGQAFIDNGTTSAETRAYGLVPLALK